MRDWRNGMNHQIPISATYALFDYINISPTFNYQERWYTSKQMKTYDDSLKTLVNDTTLYGFYRVYDYSASISVGTTLYGFYKPWAIFGGFVNMIRHRMEPSISFSVRPDFGNPKYGYYQDYSYMQNNVEMHNTYSPYANQPFGVPGEGKQGNISLTVNNNIEAKIRSTRDSTGLKKISVIDNLSFGISYNTARDTLNWSDSNVSLRLKLSESYTLNLTGMFDTYIYAYNEQTKLPYHVNTPRWKAGKGLGRLRSTGTAFSYTFDNNSIKSGIIGSVYNSIRRLFGSGDLEVENTPATNREDDWDEDNQLSDLNTEASTTRTRLRTSQQQSQSGEYDDDGYYKATIPWSFNISYTMSLGYGAFNLKKMEYDYIRCKSNNFL
jgi:hypothetical protein